MNVNRLRNLCVEIYKSINKLNPEFMNNISKVISLREQYKINLKTPKGNQVTLGAKSLKVYRPKVWSSLPFHIKTSQNLIAFKSLMKNWNDVHVVSQLAHQFYFSIMNFMKFQADISFHTKILQFPLRMISSVVYRLKHVTDHLTIKP